MDSLVCVAAQALRSAVVEAAKAQATASLAASDPTLKTMLDDLVKDLEGQVTEATSRQDWWTRWGKHYLPSLVSAHALQQCNNFKVVATLSRNDGVFV